MISSLLIANRGEIACRIIRTARRMGIRTIAVHSDADRFSLHVKSADEARYIGPSPASESYLVGEAIIAAALDAGAQAIHPGYGFLSENADFAQAVIDAGLIWIGPRPDSIRAMGLKDAAKALMASAGVSVTPGYQGDDQSPERLEVEAGNIGYPVLIKAVAGGGGKGMRRVECPADFGAALEACRREALASFGNDQVLIEKLIPNPRHIEVQVFGDNHGNVVHLFERDCSLQRRHQKVIEEAPAPGMDDTTRQAICDAAVRAAKAVGYIGAGTIEFIADGSEGLRADRIWFMEMNTRLQVEHPVTEEITGVDLVEWQLRVAAGEPIPLAQDDLAINGHAIEARLYAEDPVSGFLPSTGQLEVLRLPRHERVETGVEQGDEVSPFYDPMIAKIVVHRHDRATAIAAMGMACRSVSVWPVKQNAWFLSRLMDLPEFTLAAMTTSTIADSIEGLTAPPQPSRDLLAAAAAESFFRHVDSDESERIRGLAGFRLNAAAHPVARMQCGTERVVIPIDFDAAGRFSHNSPHHWRADGCVYFEDGAAFQIRPERTDGVDEGGISDGSIVAPMPGTVIALDVSQGDNVAKGQRLLVLEAMKMEHALLAPYDGTVEMLDVEIGAQVQVDAVLARIERMVP